MHFNIWRESQYDLYSIPVSQAVPYQVYPDVLQPVTEVKIIEQKPALVVLEQISQQPAQPLRERDDDWFVLLDAVREETIIVPPGIRLVALFAFPVTKILMCNLLPYLVFMIIGTLAVRKISLFYSFFKRLAFNL